MPLPSLPVLINAVLPRKSAPYRDPMGRKPGESLDANRFTVAQLEGKKRLIEAERPGAFQGEWQQDPLPEGGAVLNIDKVTFQGDPAIKGSRRVLTQTEFYSAAERERALRWVRFWDLAYTAPGRGINPDWTVGALAGIRRGAWNEYFEFYLADVVRLRGSWATVRQTIRDVAAQDGKGVMLGVEKNGPQSAAYQDILMDPELGEYTVYPAEPHARDAKVVRAKVWAARAEVGNMYICKGAWNSAFYDEIETFPNGLNDDIVDAISGAYEVAWLRLAEADASDYAGQKTSITVKRKW